MVAAAVLGFALLLGPGGVQTAQAAPAAAAVEPDLEVLAHPQRPQIENWRTGTSRYWRVEARVVGIGTARARLQLAGSGSMVTDPELGLRVAVVRCTGNWSTTALTRRPVCAGTEHPVVVEQRLDAHASEPDVRAGVDRATRAWSWALPDLTGQWQHLLVELSRPALVPGQSVEAQRAEFGVGIHVAGQAPQVEPVTETNPPDPHGTGDPTGPTTGPTTGLPDAGGPLLGWVAAGVTCLGLGLVVRRRA